MPCSSFFSFESGWRARGFVLAAAARSRYWCRSRGMSEHAAAAGRPARQLSRAVERSWPPARASPRDAVRRPPTAARPLRRPGQHSQRNQRALERVLCATSAVAHLPVEEPRAPAGSGTFASPRCACLLSSSSAGVQKAHASLALGSLLHSLTSSVKHTPRAQ